VQKQNGTKDLDHFAIAFATVLSTEENYATTLSGLIKTLQLHLCVCLEN